MKSPDWRLTFGHANKHLATVERLSQRFLKPQPYTSAGYTDRDTHQHITRAKRVRTVPPAIALEVQDALTDFRSSLDQLVFSLTWSYSGRELSGTAFPVTESETEFYGNGTRSGVHKIRGVCPEAFACIEALQPYYGWDAVEDSPLWQLNKLRNVLHDQLHVMAVQSDNFLVNFDFGPEGVILQSGESLTVAVGDVWIDTATERDAPIAGARAYRIGGPQPQVKVEHEPPYAIAFGPTSPLKRLAVLETLQGIRDHIADEVFGWLERFMF